MRNEEIHIWIYHYIFILTDWNMNRILQILKEFNISFPQFSNFEGMIVCGPNEYSNLPFSFNPIYQSRHWPSFLSPHPTPLYFLQPIIPSNQNVNLKYWALFPAQDISHLTTVYKNTLKYAMNVFSIK